MRLIRTSTVYAVVGLSLCLFSHPLLADYTSALSGTVTMTGNSDADILFFTDGATLIHNRFAEGDAGFNSGTDFDTAAGGDQTANGIGVTVNAGDGADTVEADLATLGTFTFNGENGDDTLTGSIQADTLNGGPGNDTLGGLGGVDILNGGDGDDNINGNTGNDQLFGGAGSDTFLWNPGDGSDTIEGGDGGLDLLIFTGSPGMEEFAIAPVADRVSLFRNLGSHTLDLAGLELIRLTALGNNDLVTITPLPSTVTIVDGGDGSDTLVFDCQGGEVASVSGVIQPVGGQAVFHSNFETITLTDCTEVPLTDTDGDGILDDSDNCPESPNADQQDDDDDGLGDACDDDPEGDGVAAGDNCPAVANADQRDTDDDGAGNACDPDADGDGVLNGDDNCLLTPNTDQADANENGIGNLCETPASTPDDTTDGDDDEEAGDQGGCSLIR